MVSSAQIRDLVQQIQLGRQEDDHLEWKRQWWRLKTPEGKSEFLKDISALANSHEEQPGVIIIGIKNGNLYDAPMPLDEADLQQLVKKITPTPKVRFSTLSLSDSGHQKILSTVIVCPPFNPPYVCPVEAKNIVFVRHGSSIGTATRFDLDRFYEKRKREPRLRAEWECWEDSFRAEGRGKTSKILHLPGPLGRINELQSWFSSSLSGYKERSLEEGYPTSDLLRSYEEQIPRFLESLTIRENLIHWGLRLRTGILVSVRISNIGTGPASDVKIRVRFPDWVHIGKKKKDPPDSYVEPPSIPWPSQMSTPGSDLLGDERSQKFRQIDDFMSRFPMHSVDLPPLQQKATGVTINVNTNTVTFWASDLLHAHERSVRDTVLLSALPDAPPRGSSIPVNTEYFCAEQDSWIAGDLQIDVGETDWTFGA